MIHQPGESFPLQPLMPTDEKRATIGGSRLLIALVVFGLLRTQTGRAADPSPSETPVGGAPSVHASDQAFQWKPALREAALMLVFQHAARLVQPKTRRELGGPFLKDYFESVSTIHTWNDSDSILTNYVGHPMMGAVAGYIQIFNDPRGRYLAFEPSSGAYWRSRLKAMAWSAAFSTQYEIGPVIPSCDQTMSNFRGRSVGCF